MSCDLSLSYVKHRKSGPGKVHVHYVGLLCRCWDNEPQNRPTMTEIREKLEKLCKVC